MQVQLLKVAKRISSTCRRDLGVFAPALQKASDPIQQLFIDKLREYKSKSAGGQLVEPTPELSKELESDKLRVYKQYKMKPGEDLSKFPTINYPEPKYEPPSF